MVNLEKFIIELDKEAEVYSPGERVSGRLILENKDSLKVKNVIIKLRGEAFVYW